MFVYEIAEQEGAAGPSRDRLLEQLARAGVDVDERSSSTSDLLDLGTVAIGTAGSDTPPPRWRRPWIPWAAAAVLGVGVTAAVVAAVWPSRGSGDPPAVVRPAGPVADEIVDHLSQPSLRRAVAAPAAEVVPEAAEAPAAKSPGARPARATRAAKAASSRRQGWLNCNSWPWSEVYLDGHKLRGNTPIYRVKVAAGRHRVKFVNPELGLSKEVTVSVEPDETKTVAISLQ